MEKYWKLLDIEDGEYSVHETEEEVNHIIDYKTRNYSDDKVTKRIDIETPFSNYDFQFVYVFDEHHVHQFLYFYDTIEEERDDFEERVMILQTHRDTDADVTRRAYEDAYEAMESCLKDEIAKLSNQLDEITKQRDNAINILNKKTTNLFNANRIIDNLRHQLSECESALEHAECFMTGHKDEAESLKEENERLESKLSKANRMIDTQRERIYDLQENLNKIRDAAFPF